MIGLKFKKSNHITKVFLSITFSAFIALGSFSSFVLAQSAEDDEYTRSYNELKAAEKLANDEYFRKENQQKAAEKLEREESEKKLYLFKQIKRKYS